MKLKGATTEISQWSTQKSNGETAVEAQGEDPPQGFRV